MKNLTYLLIFLFSFNFVLAQQKKLPEGFVYLKEQIPDIKLDIRYAGNNNFIGKPVNSYNKPTAILTEEAATALQKAQKDLMAEGYCFKIFDAYRPQTAVNHFIEWARKPEDTLTKQRFYPEVAKKDLFQLGYIATKSGHSRGSTVDLTIIDAQNGEELDMGSGYDFFGDISHHSTNKITKEQRANRSLLKRIMIKNGFRPYPEEWWHYTLRNEPFPETYFDFPVQ
ncbi:peptidase M15 [Salegentibacter salinarum]|uniref:D-alanyl-D-alanine dipeptidase n=1 Tax=Salegentibacter salinarum TaxID=447422 RepID=A0A2N0TM95_9FLAO|nr:M15 family metallopeptidase [Salegentibacter salinarum]PKD15863.1 peptidase M15 [Salegentibacter salinarum]SKB72722.1 D-alanyl-D-alanine dipeptidase [Salegentibacter salinarum]